MTYQRALNAQFLADLKATKPEHRGMLVPLLARVKEDDTLMLALRGDYVNIYYRGGNLLKIAQNPGGNYLATFDTKYNKAGHDLPTFPFSIASAQDAVELIRHIPALKYTMDSYFSGHRKPEREFQQLVARENNCSPISNETEYFIVDIEAAGAHPKARFDMLGVRWLRNERKKQKSLVPVLIEMKYGIQALDGKSGLQEHLDDAHNISIESWKSLCADLQAQVNQLADLGLLEFNRSQPDEGLELDPDGTPELVFLLANYNPASTKLSKFLATLDVPTASTEEKIKYDLLFSVSSFAGYGLHRACMLSLEEFKAMVAKLFASAKLKTK